MKRVLIIKGVCLAMLALGCSKNDDGPVVEPVQKPTEPEKVEAEVLTGVFKDAEVQGLGFETASQNGVTNAKGEFSYLADEDVTFKVGGLTLGTVKGQELVTPITLASAAGGEAKVSDPIAMNMAALLQTLDADRDATNGITITAEVSANLGVSEIDFSEPIERSLADIVLHTSQNGGAYLKTVYPSIAARHMADSLEEPFEAEADLAVSHFLPFLESVFSSRMFHRLPPSTVFAHTFDESGKLSSTEIVSRYSGRVLYMFTYGDYSPEGLPTTGQVVYNVAELPQTFGYRAPVSDTTISFDLVYDAEYHVVEMNRFYNGSDYNQPIVFTAYDEARRPLVWSEIFQTDDFVLRNRTDYTITYIDGSIATETIVSAYESNTYSSDTSQIFTLTSDAAGNFTLVESTYQSASIEQYSGEIQEYEYTEENELSFTYNTDLTLASRIGTGNSIGDDEPFSYRYEFNYDGEELLASTVYTNSYGTREETTLEGGIETAEALFNNGQLNSERTYFPDGSYEQTQYYYFEDGSLSDSATTTYNIYGNAVESTWYNAQGNITRVDTFDADGLIDNRTYYDGGNVSFVVTYIYNNDGTWASSVTTDANGTVTGSSRYTYNSNGSLDLLEYLDAEGNFIGGWDYEYDANGFYSVITYLDAGGNATYIEYYEDGELTRTEEYDAEGNLIGETDYTTTAKVSRMVKRTPSNGKYPSVSNHESVNVKTRNLSGKVFTSAGKSTGAVELQSRTMIAYERKVFMKNLR